MLRGLAVRNDTKLKLPIRERAPVVAYRGDYLCNYSCIVAYRTTLTKQIFIGIVKKTPTTMKYLLLLICFTTSAWCHAQQILLDMDHFPVVKNGIMTIGYQYINCDTVFKKPFNFVVQVCDSGMFQPCAMYIERIAVDSIVHDKITWTLNKVPISLCGTLLVTASIETPQGEKLLESTPMKVYMTCYLPKKDSAQIVEK